MAGENCTLKENFILLGFTDCPVLKNILFVIFLLIYIITVVGNTVIIWVVKINSHLQTPMYFFLSNLSFLDLCYSSVVTPKMLVNFLHTKKIISYTGCILQLYFYAGLATTECYLLAVMAYDRYVAICNPLIYTYIMSRRICIFLVVFSYLAGFLNSTIQTGFSLRVTCCKTNVIDHFFCDGPPLSYLYFSDITLNELLLFTIVGFNEVTTTSLVFVSYCCIIFTILRMDSVKGKYKAFSTCTSHLMVVTLFYGTLLFMYLRPTTSYSMNIDKVVSVFYTMIIPMLNPIIYSLKNKEVVNCMKKILKGMVFSK
ncbi:LOW QUALITY PROTEIN: olfactory receptor 5AS1-like [Thamnophis elegans]|uniref:LOW QUALITY PROTEIN: olfactory receptor 5AS1-like n=1 Tax=Thamnophis elegans TaxID=35005 RepID=UPI001376A1A3|nr:LOW QUALITY PROTEIN: olfactory receptor 5AS1-like [Thamnophis elegans]